MYYKDGSALFLKKVCPGQHIRTGTQAIFFHTDLLVSFYTAIWPSKPAHADKNKYCPVAAAGVHTWVQWVHRLGEAGSGSNVTDPVASPKGGDATGVSIPQGQKGRRKETKQWGVRDGRGSSPQAAWAPARWTDKVFLIFIVITAHPSHCNESAMSPGSIQQPVLWTVPVLCDCSHRAVRNPLALPPASSTASMGYSPWPQGALLCCPTQVWFVGLWEPQLWTLLGKYEAV